MKEHPILFSAEMVRANLENRKNVTRRLNGLEKVNENPDEWEISDTWIEKGYIFFEFSSKLYCSTIEIKCRYGQAGDRLWVKETFVENDNPLSENFKGYEYRADYEGAMCKDLIKWKPSIFMTRRASRITLEVVNIRVERLQEISEKDAIAEGIERVGGEFSCSPWKNYRKGAKRGNESSLLGSDQILHDIMGINQRPRLMG